MAHWPLPPYGEPPGPRVDDAEVLLGFARGRAVGHSEVFHVEGNALVAGGDVAAGLRVAAGAVLVRVDLPEDLVGHKASVEMALAAEGLTLLDEETLLAAPAAVQVLGLRGSTWDLWGTDLDEAFAALRAVAVGEQVLPPWDAAEGPPWDAGEG